jgi:DNA-binding Xre family transcriptional regulator
MPKTKNYGLLHERVVARPGAEQRVAEHRAAALIEIGLYELRRSQDVSQVELAARLEITQAAVSKFESSDDVRLSTLRQYIEALGGHLEVSARFDDRSVQLAIRPATALGTRPRSRR